MEEAGLMMIQPTLCCISLHMILRIIMESTRTIQTVMHMHLECKLIP